MQTQAYDGHMNLILSDVEETIMIVDLPEGQTEGTGAVSVREQHLERALGTDVLGRWQNGNQKCSLFAGMVLFWCVCYAYACRLQKFMMKQVAPGGR